MFANRSKLLSSYRIEYKSRGDTDDCVDISDVELAEGFIGAWAELPLSAKSIGEVVLVLGLDLCCSETVMNSVGFLVEVLVSCFAN